MLNLKEILDIRTIWTTKCYDKYNNLLWIENNRPNTITTEGRNRILNEFFYNALHISTWYVGLIVTDEPVVIGDTYDVHAFTEGDAEYSEETRVAFVPNGASTVSSMSNSLSTTNFSIVTTCTIFGSALFSLSTKGDHTIGTNNVLFSGSLFSAGRLCESGHVLHITTTVGL